MKKSLLFKNLLNLTIYANLLKVPGTIPFLRNLAKWKILKFYGIDYVPKDNALAELNQDLPDNPWIEIEVEHASICGTDKSNSRLSWSPYILKNNPNVAPHDTGRIFQFQHKIATQLDKIGIIDLENQPILSSFTSLHEIVASFKDKHYVVYPILSCDVKEGTCSNCENNLENFCTRFWEGEVRGISIGLGALTKKGLRLGGGGSDSLVVHKSQLMEIPDTLDHRLAVLTDVYACAINGYEMIGDIDKKEPILVIGMGGLGWSIVDYLSQNEHKNVGVLIKDDNQKELVERYGFEAININQNYLENLGEQYNIIFDGVGNNKSWKDSWKLISNNGQYIDLGLASYKSIISGFKLSERQISSEYERILAIFSRKKITINVPFWASKAQYETAIDTLANIDNNIGGISEYIIKNHLQIHNFEDLTDGSEVLFPEIRAIRHIIRY